MANFKEHEPMPPRDPSEARVLEETEKRQYRALAMELAVKSHEGRNLTASDPLLRAGIMDTAANYFYYIWDGVR